MNYIFVILGLSTQLIFLFKREILLDKKKSKLLLVFNFFLFFLGLFLKDFLQLEFKLIGMLKMSLFSQLIFITMLFIFRKAYKKKPKDTYMSFDTGLLKDGIFNFIFWVLGGFVPALIFLH